MSHRNSIEFKVSARHALFTDPLTRVGGEKCSYHLPTYEALKGIAKSIYWKPTFVWVIDEVRVMNPIRTQTKGTKPLNYGGVFPSMRDPAKKEESPNTLAIYTFLADIEYQVRAHFEWNPHRPELEDDRIEGKHYAIARRSLDLGGRQDVFLGTRDCQGYVEPCEFGSGIGHYDGIDQIDYGLMFHGFDYPDETGKPELWARFWRPAMRHGRIAFSRPEMGEPDIVRKFIRPMKAKKFSQDRLRGVEHEATDLGV